jgi:hypothetical protein
MNTTRISYGHDQLGGDCIRIQQGHDVIALTDRTLMPGLLIDAGYGHDALVQLTLDQEHMTALRDFLNKLTEQEEERQ